MLLEHLDGVKHNIDNLLYSLAYLSAIRMPNPLDPLIAGKSSRRGWSLTPVPASLLRDLLSLLYKKAIALFSSYSGSHLLFHTVSSIVPSAVWVLTIVFGMGTGVPPRRIATRNHSQPLCGCHLCYKLLVRQISFCR